MKYIYNNKQCLKCSKQATCASYARLQAEGLSIDTYSCKKYVPVIDKRRSLYNATYYARQHGVEVNFRSRTLSVLYSDIAAYRDCRFFQFNDKPFPV
jgi:hypothetical protein